jgi:hypothetical protein
MGARAGPVLLPLPEQVSPALSRLIGPARSGKAPGNDVQTVARLPLILGRQQLPVILFTAPPRYICFGP